MLHATEILGAETFDSAGNFVGRVKEMFIENPQADFASLFATHPPIQDRINALVKYAGGHVMEPAVPQTPATGPWNSPPVTPPPTQPPSTPRQRGPWG